jgi:hypothetical protein
MSAPTSDRGLASKKSGVAEAAEVRRPRCLFFPVPLLL